MIVKFSRRKLMIGAGASAVALPLLGEPDAAERTGSRCAQEAARGAHVPEWLSAKQLVSDRRRKRLRSSSNPFAA